MLAARREEEPVRDRVFTGEALTEARLSRLEFQSVRFQRCRFTGCDFFGASFYDCVWEECSLSGCQFGESFWKNCALTGCKGEGAGFRAVRLKGGRLEDCILDYGIFSQGVWENVRAVRCRFLRGVFLRISYVH